MSSREQKRASRRDKKKKSFLKLGLVFVNIIALLLLSVVIVLTIRKNHTQILVCKVGNHVTPRNINNPGVFDSLTSREYNSVINYLFTRSNLSLVKFDEALPNNSYIYMIDLLLPLKYAVLKHLDYGNKQPERTAYVVIVRGDIPRPRVEEYHVGPLPFPSYHIKVTDPSYTKSKIPYNSKPVDLVEYKFLYEILRKTSEILYPLMIESYGLSYHNCTTDLDCIIFQDVSPRGNNGNERQSWFGAYRDVEGFYLHPLGLEIQIDHSARNVEKWKVYRIVYNGNFAYSAKTLMKRYLKGIIHRLQFKPRIDEEMVFSSLRRRNENSMDSELNGPKLVEPDGPRYKVDGFHVSYIKWNFNFRMRPSSGLQLFDIRFNDERIAYEISFQESVIFHSGYGPLADIVNIYGNSLIMGASATELIPGIDCPHTATFLDTEHFVNTEKISNINNSICIFEDHANIPLRRHYARDKDGNFRYYGGLGNYKLIVRTILNVQNFDYIFDYIFYLNGVLEMKVAISGYLFSAFPLHHELRYGTFIHNNVVANTHQHLFHYKVDIDINGTKNRFATINFNTENITRQWYNNIWKQQLVNSKHFKRNEYEANFASTPSTNQHDIIYNQFASSKFGSPRAYRIVNNNKATFLLDESEIARAATWAKFPLAVTQFQDTEVTSTSIYNGNGPWDPVVDFERFLKNNDSLIDQDIVAWVTMGIDKIPHTEDVPTISTVGSQTSFYLTPFNFFTECPSMSSKNAFHFLTENDINDYIRNRCDKETAQNCT